MLKNHNCFVLYLNCNLLFSRNFFLTNCYIFLKKFVKTQIKIFSLDFFHVSQVVLIKCTRLRLGLFYVFLECTTYNLIFTIFFFLLREFFFGGIISIFFLCVFSSNMIILVTFLSIALLKFMVPSIEINVKNHNWSSWESGHEKPMRTKTKIIFSKPLWKWICILLV